MATWTNEHAEKMLKKWGDPRLPSYKWWRWKRLLLEKVESLVQGESILDVGCGIGHLYSLLKDKKYYGVDFKPMVDICRELFPEGDFKVGQIDNLKDFGRRDTVVCVSTLIHLPGDLTDYLWKLRVKARHQLIFTMFPPKRVEKTWMSEGVYGIDEPILGHIWSWGQVSDALEKLDSDYVDIERVTDGVRTSLVFNLLWDDGY